MKKSPSIDRPTTLGELVRALSLVMEDDAAVLQTLKALSSSGAIRSREPERPELRVA